MASIKKWYYIAVFVVFVGLLGYLSLIKHQRDNARNSLDIASKRIELLESQIKKTNQQLKTIQKLDKDYQERLRNAQTENDKLRDDLVNNVKRVYVKATCPSLPNNSATTIKPNAATPRLTGDTRQDYLRLRLEIGQVINQVKGLQDYIRNICQK